MTEQKAGAPTAAEQKKERDNLALEVVAGPCKTKEAFMAKGASITVGRTKKSTLHLQDSAVSRKTQKHHARTHLAAGLSQ